MRGWRMKSGSWKLRRMGRQLSRKRKGSKNRKKARLKLARLHYRLSCIRQDSLHKLTTYLTNNYGWILSRTSTSKACLRTVDWHGRSRIWAFMSFAASSNTRRPFAGTMLWLPIAGSLLPRCAAVVVPSRRACRWVSVNFNVRRTDLRKIAISTPRRIFYVR